ncbi:MAG: hypothetical protein ACFE9P_11230 [Candidatus Hermodarchaeota archaeon]
MLKKNIQIFAIGLIIIGICILSIYQIYHTPQLSSTNYNNELQTQAFSKEDYSPIIEEEKQALGNITVTDLNFNQKGFFNNSGRYPDLEDDLISGALNMLYLGTEFVETKDLAQVDNLNKNIVDSNKITVILNESIDVVYDTTFPNVEGYLIYGPRLFPCKLIQLLLKNESISIQEVSENEYEIDPFNFLYFDYLQYFETNRNTFTMYLIWEYNITIRDWILYQDSKDKMLVQQQQEVVSPLFYYNFSVIGQKFVNFSDRIFSEDVDLNLKLNLPDKDRLYGHTLKVGAIEINNFLNLDNSVNVSTVGNRQLISLTFSANYTIVFINPVEKTWAIDRLVKNQNIRERIYFPSLIEGPRHILLKYLMIYEDTIIVDQVISNSSLFSRDVQYYDLNISKLKEEFQPSLIFTKNAVKKLGIKIVLPYLIVGETAPLIIKYDANSNLIIKVTDIINMPLVGVDIELYYFQKNYGTYISNDLNQVMSPSTTNENGQVVIRYVPNGNYIIRIYDGTILIKEAVISTYNEINLVRTDRIHFPLVILFFLIISSVSLLLGLISYTRYKKRRNLK